MFFEIRWTFALFFSLLIYPKIRKYQKIKKPYENILMKQIALIIIIFYIKDNFYQSISFLNIK